MSGNDRGPRAGGTKGPLPRFGAVGRLENGFNVLVALVIGTKYFESDFLLERQWVAIRNMFAAGPLAAALPLDVADGNAGKAGQCV